MNLTVFVSGDDVFKNCECIKGYAFKMVATRDKSVDSTVLNASYHMHAS